MTLEEFDDIRKNGTTGMDYTATVKAEGIQIHGKIYIHPERTKFHLCHDNRLANGSEAMDKLGYRYSWGVFTTNFSAISITLGSNVSGINNNYSIY